MKRRLPFRALTIMVVLATQSFSLHPEFNSSGYFLLTFEDEIAQETRANATVYGVETWYRDFLWEIEYYVQYGPFMGYLPKPGSYVPEWTEINENSLADQIWDCVWLELDDVPGPGDGDQNIRPEIVQALYDDHYNNSGAWTRFDPISRWKWRSTYIEDLHSKSFNMQTKANCYGLPNYLSRDFAWSEEYTWNYFRGVNSGWPAERCMLPFINLDNGSEPADMSSWPYSFLDEDQDPRNGRADLVHQHSSIQRPWGYNGSATPDGFYPGDGLNAFDIVRLASTPDVDAEPDVYDGRVELGWRTSSGNWINTGVAVHAWAYLCTDELGESWVYEYGGAGQAFLGKMTTASFQNCWHTYFKKFGYHKILKAADYNRNWADVSPVPSGY